MNKILLILSFAALFIYKSIAEPIIIDHNCIKIDKIPEEFVTKAKNNLRIAYGHTSHGSQITTGMNYLKSLPNSIFIFNQGEGTLSYSERIPGANDLGNPNRIAWEKATRNLLDDPKNDRNMIMWSWCGQVSSADEDDINTYLTLMDKLEKDYPDVTFVYMTGHLDGSGVDGNLNQRNNQIREFCRRNDKILFDFADIESYDPDGNYFLDKGANDGCYYYDDNHNRKNWADEWCQRNPGKCASCGCAHSKCLNCQMKGIALWWMLSRIEGWDGETPTDVDTEPAIQFNFNISPNPANETINVYMDLPEETNINYEIFNVNGMLLQSSQLGYFSNGYYPASIDISNLPNGMYFIKLVSADNWMIKSFIKN